MNTQITVSFQNVSQRKIMPLHGVNSGPMTKVFTYDARPQFRDAGFPYARLHDVEYPYGSGEFVDIHCIFPDFDADETKEESYNFSLTDIYLSHIIEVGCEPLFRLGESIEHAPIKRHIFPPKDFCKWARICEHIIRHYTEGWANGFHWNITYWEIWNEADGGSKNNWQGTPEEFYKLYCVTATHLKRCFPHLKIGGCAFTRGVNEFTKGFFRYITSQQERIPLDFYSWHRYFSTVDTMLQESRAVDELLTSYGYADTESVFDEWNYMENWNDQAESYRILKAQKGAAFNAAVLCAMQQQTNISLATYFEADVVKEWCGLFEVENMGIGRQKATVRPLKGFYAFKAFHTLYQMGEGVNVRADDGHVYSCAARGNKKNAVFIANYSDSEATVTLSLSDLCDLSLELRIVDKDHDFEVIDTYALSADHATVTIPMQANSFFYLGSKI